MSKQKSLSIPMDSLCERLERLDASDGPRDGEASEVHVQEAKNRVRNRIWHLMETQGLLRPFHKHRDDGEKKIPYFKGCDFAARLTADKVDAFNSASVIKVNPSLAQMKLRQLSLFAGKKVLVPVPALEEDDTFLRLIDGSQLSRRQSSKAMTKAGAVRFGVPLLSAEDFAVGGVSQIDLVVVGSVAVSKEGVRLGKGRGLAELEWGILWEMGLVDQDTVVLTTVHERQVVSSARLPLSVMEKHDLPVDVIVTPRKMITVKKRLKKPSCGVLWDRLREEDIERMPVLRRLRPQLSSNESKILTSVSDRT